MQLIPKNFINYVVPIGVRTHETIQWIATGFFLTKLFNNKKKLLFFVTNKHVFDNLSSAVIRVKVKNTEELREFDLGSFANGVSNFFVHSNIDIAVALVNKAFITDNNLQVSAFDIDIIGSSSDLLYKVFDEGLPVYTLGYPTGWVITDSNTPICRSGCLARIDKNEIAKTKSFLLDIPAFPGSSGGPVITKSELIVENGDDKLSRSVLLGIIHSYKDFQEPIVDKISQKIIGIRLENSGLSLAYPTEIILEVIDQLIQNILSCKCITQQDKTLNL